MGLHTLCVCSLVYANLESITGTRVWPHLSRRRASEKLNVSPPKRILLAQKLSAA